MCVLLIINKVNKRYEGIQALNDVSLEIPEGSCYGLVGPNGAGKSTLIKIIATIIQDFNGHISLQEERLNKANKNKLGYVPDRKSVV